MGNKAIYKIIIYILLITGGVIWALIDFNIKNLLGISLVIYNGSLLYKFKNDKKSFFLFLILFYFNYSFCITKYIGIESNLLRGLYRQITDETTYILGIVQQIFFLIVIDFVLSSNKVKKEKVNNILDVSFRYNKLMIIVLDVFLIFILGYHLINNISNNSTLFEYSVFIFIFALYFCRKEYKLRIFTELLLMVFALYSLKNGDRIAVLQFLIADFLINYINKLSNKKVLLLLISGIFIFTFLGLYGDILDYKGDLSQLTIDYTFSKIKERRLALDTSVSAYFSGLSIINNRDKYNADERIKNGLEFFTKYTVLGSKAQYVDPSIKVKEYQINYGGAFLTTYFYYWFGALGVLLIGLYIGLLLRWTMNSGSLYGDLLNIFIISTIPRWYLYIPTLLFRGIIIFSIIYFLISKFFCIKNRNAT